MPSSDAPVIRLPAPPPFSREMTSIGVTGTNGKTTTTMLTGAALRERGGPVVRVTTVGSFIDDEPLDVTRDRDGFLEAMRIAHERGGRRAAIELTSEALAFGYAKLWPFRIGVFTNLTRDHLDAHGSAEHYLASKAQLFMHLATGGTAVLNGCDPMSELLAEVIRDGVTVWRYGCASRGPADRLDVEGKTEVTWDGTRVQLVARGALAELGSLGVLETRGIGDVFAENALAALCAAVAAGVPVESAARAIAAAPPPPGRFERVGPSKPYVVVDYAHTPDALRRTLQTARSLTGGAVWVVFGAGGDRDRAKRPQMGEAAAVADRIVLTSDNPRSEDPAAIAAAIASGIPAGPSVITVLDRAEAIRRAVLEASDDDVVVLAGKGHETDQEALGERRPFRDADVATSALSERRS